MLVTNCKVNMILCVIIWGYLVHSGYTYGFEIGKDSEGFFIDNATLVTYVKFDAEYETGDQVTKNSTDKVML